MKAKNVTLNDVKYALERVNLEHEYQLIFEHLYKDGNKVNFRIRSLKSGIPGSRVSWTGRKLVSASWHAHGYLFDEIFKSCPKAVILSGGKKITAEQGNWQDSNIGSYYSPVMFSDTSIL